MVKRQYIHVSKKPSNLQLEWDKRFTAEEANHVVQSLDGGFVFCGSINGSALLVKTDNNGNKTWEKTFFPVNSQSTASCVQETSNGGFVVCGDSSSSAFILKTDNTGKLIWTHNFEMSQAKFVQVTSDSGFVFCGAIAQTNYPQPWLVKFDKNGNKIWDGTVPGQQDAAITGYCVRELSNNDFILCGIFQPLTADNWSWTAEMNSIGQFSWYQFYRVPSYSLPNSAYCIRQISNNSLMYCGSIENNPTKKLDPWFVKTDLSGNVISHYNFGGSFNEEMYSFDITCNNRYVLAGYRETAGSDTDGWIIFVDNNGNQLFDLAYGGVGDDEFRCVKETNEGDFIMCGTTSSSTGTEAWLVKLKENKQINADFSATPISGTAPLSVQFSNNSTGNGNSYSWDFGDGGTSTQINPTHIYQNKGNYDVCLTISNGNECDKMVKRQYIHVTATTTINDLQNNSLPVQFSLLQNFPNPFNPETQISYNLPKSCHVKLEIFNQVGQQIIILIDQNQSKGFHKIKWNGLCQNSTAVVSGIYFYKITAGDFTSLRKMVLLR